MTEADRLQKAIELAVKSHAGQYRDNGEPFILHPMRVMMGVDTLQEKTIAILHDVVEDTNVTISNIQATLGLDDLSCIVRTLCILTHNTHSYDTYILLISKTPQATKIKLADLKDNLNMLSYEEAGDLQVRRFKKHHKAFKMLNK